MRGIDLVLIFYSRLVAEQEEVPQPRLDLNFTSPPHSNPQLPCKQYSPQPIGEPLVAVQFPPQELPQPLPQEVMHTLVHIPEQVELLQLLLHVLKQPLIQLVKHQPSQLEVGP